MKRVIHGFLWVLVSSCALNDDEPKPLTFYVLGDWGRKGNPNQMVVAQQMNEWAQQENPDFIVSTGDNFYDEGVRSSDDQHWRESFEKVYTGSAIKEKPWYVSLGNHDYLGNPDMEIQYSNMSFRWRLPAPYYSKVFTLPDGSKLRMIVIDTSPFEKSYYNSSMRSKLVQQDSARQKRWLDSLSALNDVQWKVVVGHHHIYTGGARKNDLNTVRQALEPVFAKNNVDVYFCGHEHDLQYLKSANKPTHYFLSGAGSDLRPTGKIAETIYSASIQGFMSVQVTQHAFVVKMIDYKGQELFRKEIIK